MEYSNTFAPRERGQRGRRGVLLQIRKSLAHHLVLPTNAATTTYVA